MNIETVREYCLSLPLVTEDFPFDERTLAFRVLGKIFACIDLERPNLVTMKCDPVRPSTCAKSIPRWKVHGIGTRSIGIGGTRRYARRRLHLLPPQSQLS